MRPCNGSLSLLARCLLAVAVAGCAGDDSPTPRPASAPAPAAAPAARAAPAPAPPGSPRTLLGRREDEAAARPTATRHVEDVVAALTAAGVAVTGTRQVLARVVRATYCVGADGDAGLAIAICEYADADAAAAGQAYSERTFGAVQPNRRLLRNRHATLTLTVPADERGAQAADAAAAAFMALPASAPRSSSLSQIRERHDGVTTASTRGGIP